MRTTLFFALLFFVFTGCNRDDCGVDLNLNVDETQLAADIAAIDTFLATNPAILENYPNIVIQEHPSGLRYGIINPGDGESANLCSNVVVDYTGSLFDGSIFDSSSRPVGFSLRSLITGWQIGIPIIKERGEILLFIPSVYAYGEQERPSIPANSNLVFNIELYVAQ